MLLRQLVDACRLSRLTFAHIVSVIYRVANRQNAVTALPLAIHVDAVLLLKQQMLFQQLAAMPAELACRICTHC